MKKFFNEEQRIIIKAAIEDHRASLEYVPRSAYGKIISTADFNIDIITALKRTHAYTIKHYPDYDLNQMIDRAYKHIIEKFGDSGYARIYCIDEEFNQFKEDVKKLTMSKDMFKTKYMEVNFDTKEK